MNLFFRYLKPWISMLGILVLAGACTGCASLMASNMSQGQSTIKAGEVVLTDTIFALGKPDANMSKYMGSEKIVAFLGKQKTYLLVSGGLELMDLAQKLDSKKIQLDADSHALYEKDGTVWGQLRFRYPGESVAALVDSERQNLAALKFKKAVDGNSYYVDIQVQGKTYPPLDLEASGFKLLDRSRDLVFHAPSTSERKPNIAAGVVMPVAIAVDVITAPFQMLGLVAFGLVMDTNKHKR